MSSSDVPVRPRAATPSGGGADPDAEFAAELAGHLAAYGERPCIEFERRWYSGAEVIGCVRAISAELDRLGVARTDRVGIVVRNRVPHAAAVFACIVDGRSVTMINSYQSVTGIARDVAELRPAVVIADAREWEEPLCAACAEAGSAGIAVSAADLGAEAVVPRGDRETAGAAAGSGLYILTSGTTGPPKRVRIPLSALRHTVATMTAGRDPAPEDPPELVYWPFGSVGICQLLAGPFLAKRMVLFERFTVDEWVRAIKTYRVRTAGVQPTILRMVLQANVPRADLASLEYLPGGSGPLEPGLRAEFEARYGIPLLWAYGATEFGGSVCAWTLDTHRRYGAAKPDSVGRPLPGVEVRVVDPETGAAVGAGERGVLTARVAALGPEFVRTTDLASVDADGFVTIHGRADGAINRGGFKILPERVRAVLLGHSAIRDACVVGVPDSRLGQVPFAVVELRHGHPAPSEAELQDLVREALPSHHVPVAVDVVDALPRNAAMKPKVPEVVALYGERGERSP
ncbi:class I adenylate-forming enzyme family protein [Nocardia sp. alder85J]|uniref:class I adenylate-forming enzyme family protein n=1 Tax=Nocardia sp. alder85J TaxID=2862949 RepID=UPI001CD79553|nr:fatty acid--CoA ligase family protein [Nocardia sp. alder85J]MCX4096794.1 fatty acid--CoA ligase family protein [Nocardia sp. alder85J]